jgi:NTP pyrophosphatase (non-canonical NTP hydrolase)
MIDLTKYSEFVQAITSDASNNLGSLVASLDRLNAGKPEVNVSLLLTGAMGMCGEAGEFSEIVKKAMFHGKQIDKEVLAHMNKELGDVIWYWVNTCRALNLDPNQVIADNVAKLSARYAGGVFSVEASESRKAGDV